MKNDIAEIMITEEQIKDKIKEMGQKIAEDYKGKELILIGILRGSVIFLADLARAIDLPLQFEFMAVSSYGNGTTTSGAVEITQDLTKSIEGKDVLIVEDIIDSGLTLSYLMEVLKLRRPSSIKIATLLTKPSRRKANVEVSYCGFEIPDKFAVGYGLDYASIYRNLPYIGVLKEEVYNK